MRRNANALSILNGLFGDLARCGLSVGWLVGQLVALGNYLMSPSPPSPAALARRPPPPPTMGHGCLSSSDTRPGREAEGCCAALSSKLSRACDETESKWRWDRVWPRGGSGCAAPADPTSIPCLPLFVLRVRVRDGGKNGYRHSVPPFAPAAPATAATPLQKNR